MHEKRDQMIRKTNKNLLMWCILLFVFWGAGILGCIEYRNNLYTADEIDTPLCREIIAKGIFELEQREVPLDEITIIDIKTINDTIIVGYTCSDKYATRYCDKGFLKLEVEKDGLYYVGACYHEYNPTEIGRGSAYTDDMGRINRVSTAFGIEHISDKEYLIFLSDDPTLERIYMSGDGDFKNIEKELDIFEAPYMYIMEMPKTKSLYITFKSAQIEPGTHVRVIR